jgi:hypothetical protein
MYTVYIYMYSRRASMYTVSVYVNSYIRILHVSVYICRHTRGDLLFLHRKPIPLEGTLNAQEHPSENCVYMYLCVRVMYSWIRIGMYVYLMCGMGGRIHHSLVGMDILTTYIHGRWILKRETNTHTSTPIIYIIHIHTHIHTYIHTYINRIL